MQEGHDGAGLCHLPEGQVHHRHATDTRKDDTILCSGAGEHPNEARTVYIYEGR